MTPPTRIPAAEALAENVAWLRRLARSLVSDPGAADDLSQEAWVVALEDPPPTDRPLRGWLAGVLRNRARLRGRGELRRRAREREAARSEALPSTAELLARLSTQKQLVAHVEALAEPYRTTVLLRYFEGLTPGDVAERQGVPLATVKTRLRRGLERLRARLDQSHGGDRRAWCLALSPLVRAPIAGVPVDPTATAAATVGAPSAVAGALLMMSVKIPAAVVLVVVTAAAAGLLWTRSPGIPALPEASAAPAAPAAPLAREPRASDTVAVTERPEQRRFVPAPVVAEAPEEPDPAPAPLLRGRVIDMTSAGVPQVTVRFDGPEGGERARTVTSAGGIFELEPSEQMGSGVLRVEDERLTTVLASLAWSWQPLGNRELTVIAAPRAPLAGIVVDGAGHSVAGAQVALAMPSDLRHRFDAILDVCQEESWRTTTDASGLFELPDAPLVEGTRLRVEKEGFADSSQKVQGPDAALRIVLGEGEVEPFISGRVLDPLGEPVAGAYVALGFSDDRSDSEGRFTIDVRQGEQMEGADTLRAVLAGYLPAELAKDPESGWPSTCELRFPGSPLAISGRVLSAEGEPLDGVTVQVVDKTELGAIRTNPEDPFSTLAYVEDLAAGAGPRSEGPRTDGDGRFTLGGLLPRDYVLEAFDERDLAQARVEGVAAGSAGIEIRMPASLARGPVAGRVLGLDGSPIPDVRVRPYARPPGGSDAFEDMASIRYGSTAQTGEAGAFRFEGVVTERIGLQVWGGNAFGMLHWPVPEGADLEQLEIRLPRRCHFRVELARPDLGDRIEVLDAGGEPMQVVEGLGMVALWHTDVRLQAGRTGVLAVAETARTLVLYSGDQEVVRKPMSPTPAGVEVINL